MKRILIALALATFGAGSVYAKPATCLLIVGGEFYINGDCDFEAGGGGDFTVSAKSEYESGNWIAMMSLEKGIGTMAWNADGVPGQRMDPANRLHAVEHDMRRDGACWANRNAVLCAW